MGNLTWHDAVRLYLCAGGTVVVLTLIRMQWLRQSVQRRRWRALAGAGALGLPIADGVARASVRFGHGPFDDPHRVAVIAVAVALALAWLGGEVRLVHPWQRGPGFPYRGGGR